MFLSLSRSPTEEEEGPDMRDPHVSNSGVGCSARRLRRVGWRVRDWAEAGLRPRWERKAGVAGPKPRGWAEKEKGRPVEVLFFFFFL